MMDLFLKWLWACQSLYPQTAVNDAVWCIAFICRSWTHSFGVTSALCSVWRQVFRSQIICVSFVFNPRMVRTSPSACWHSSALKRDIALRLLAFLVHYASDSSSDVRYFSSISGKVRASWHLNAVKLHVQGGSNMTGTDLCVNKPHCAAAVRPWESEATTSTLPPARVRTCSVLSGSC